MLTKVFAAATIALGASGAMMEQKSLLYLSQYSQKCYAQVGLCGEYPDCFTCNENETQDGVCEQFDLCGEFPECSPCEDDDELKAFMCEVDELCGSFPYCGPCDE